MCGSSARTDLHGGRLAIAVPTVTGSGTFPKAGHKVPLPSDDYFLTTIFPGTNRLRAGSRSATVPPSSVRAAHAHVIENTKALISTAEHSRLVRCMP